LAGPGAPQARGVTPASADGRRRPRAYGDFDYSYEAANYHRWDQAVRRQGPAADDMWAEGHVAMRDEDPEGS